MNPEQKQQLNRLIKENNVEDNTENIRSKNHSDQIRNDVITFLKLKEKYSRLSKSNPSQFEKMCESQCNFIYTHYNLIYLKLKNNEIDDIRVLDILLSIIKKIETGELDQHEGSFEFGKVLKTLYIDKELPKAEKIDKNGKVFKSIDEPLAAPKNISWHDYKTQLNKINKNLKK